MSFWYLPENHMIRWKQVIWYPPVKIGFLCRIWHYLLSGRSSGRLEPLITQNIKKAINEKTKMVAIQRSKGYQTRPSFSVEQIGELIRICQTAQTGSDLYGGQLVTAQFVETIEPSDVGEDTRFGLTDQVRGRPSGGYIVGCERSESTHGRYRLTPRASEEVGASLGIMKDFYEGLFRPRLQQLH